MLRRIVDKLTRPRFLFFASVIYVGAALAVGFFTNESSVEKRYEIAGGLLVVLAVAGILILAGFAYRSYLFMSRMTENRGHAVGLYFTDRVMRTAMNNAATCGFTLMNAFFNFYASFYSHKWYYLSVSAIFFMIFFMKLYLVSHLDADGGRQTLVIGLLILGVAVATTAVVVMVIVRDAGFAAKSYIIYWNAAYAVISLTSAIIGVVRAVKRRDKVIGRFLSVRLVNSVFGMFSLIVSLLLTFPLVDGRWLERWCVAVGITAALMMYIIAGTQLTLYFSQRTGEDPGDD